MESNLYKRLKRVTPGYHWQRHEDKLTAGIPDCSYGFNRVNGWVELKTYDNWPSDGMLKWEDLKPEQVNWLIARGKAGGHCFLLLEVGTDPKTSDILLFSWSTLRKIRQYNKEELEEVALHFGKLKGVVKYLRTP